jgi:hypothetical protein
MEMKLVNVISIAMMDKENINNMQVADAQDNHLIEGNSEYEPVTYSKNNKILKL